MTAYSYKSGTVSVSNGSTIVTGVGSTFKVSGLKEGDVFWANGQDVSITSIEDNTHLTLAFPWPGATLPAGSAYEIRFIDDGVRMIAQINEVFTKITMTEDYRDQAAASAAEAAVFGDRSTELAGLITQVQTNLASYDDTVTLITAAEANVVDIQTQIGLKFEEAESYVTATSANADSAEASKNAAETAAATVADLAADVEAAASEATSYISTITTSEANAAASAAAALVSQNDAANSKSLAETAAALLSSKADEAAQSAEDALAAKAAIEGAETSTAANAADALASKNAAALSASSAHDDMLAADASATLASTKAGEASTSAGNAAASEAVSLDHKNAAETAAGTATTKAAEADASAVIASTKAGEADTSAINAATSEVNALAHKNAAATSEANAANSASDAADSAAAAAASAASISGGPVTSVNGHTGVVTGLAEAADVYTKSEVDTLIEGASGAVSSVNGRTGDITGLAEASDVYIKSEVDALVEAAQGQVTSVNSQIGDVVLTKANIGLSNADDTSDANKPVSTAQQAALDLKAPLADAALTGTVTVPDLPAGTNNSQAANAAFVRGEIAALVASAPGTLDTLNELAAALGNDPNFATTVTASLADKADKSSTYTKSEVDTLVSSSGGAPFSSNTALAQVQAMALCF